MYSKLLKHTTMNEAEDISSRRGFLKSLAYGSLWALGGTSVVNAAVHHKIDNHAKHDAHKKSTHDALVKAKHHEVPGKSKKSHSHESIHEAAHGRKHEVIHKSNHVLAREDSHRHMQTRKHEIIHRGGHGHETSHDIFHDHDFDVVQTPSRLFSSSADNATHKSIALHNIHTGDSLQLTYYEKGRYLADALQEINHLFRVHVSGDIHPIDPSLLDQLYDLRQALGANKPYHVVSGYRSPSTNAYKHRHSEGVAKHSLHMEGRAIDIRIERVDTRTIRNVALSMHRGGVGYYPRSNFVHLDTGVFRTW